MLSPSELRQIAQARLSDAEHLIARGRPDGAYYLCGYAVEVALKARICDTLTWSGFPNSTTEFKGLQSLKTHDLEILLRFSGREKEIRRQALAAWSIVVNWDPEKRYQAIGTITEQLAGNMAEATKVLLAVL